MRTAWTAFVNACSGFLIAPSASSFGFVVNPSSSLLSSGVKSSTNDIVDVGLSSDGANSILVGIVGPSFPSITLVLLCPDVLLSLSAALSFRNALLAYEADRARSDLPPMITDCILF